MYCPRSHPGVLSPGVASGSGGGGRPVDEVWASFREDRARQLDAWIAAERALAEARGRGIADFEAGDRLLVAEATLQTAIVDYAASQPDIENPTALALQILRLAEALLDSELSSEGR